MVGSFIRTSVIALALAALSRDAGAQSSAPQVPPETVSLSGPRIGVTFLSDGVRNKLADDYALDIGPAISQIGWQWEKRFLSSSAGSTGVSEWVLLAGGFDQGTLLPSLTWLIGWRTIKGVEFAAGPNVTPVGFALAGAAGVTFRAGNLNLPVNIAVVPSKTGVRVSALAGFNSRRR